MAAAAGVGLLTKKIVSATAKQQNAIAQLAQGWKTTGGVVGRSVDEIVAKAARLQDVSIFGDEQIIEAQSQLITFTNVTEDQFDRATVAAMDLSTRMGTDLKSSVLQLGKALNDPIAGLSALSRSGVTFSESQKDMVKSLVESGRTVEAQQLMLRELEIQFGGSAKAARDTFGGALAGLSNAFGDLLEGNGSNGGMNQAKESIEELTALLQDPTTQSASNAFTSGLITGLAGASKGIIEVVQFLRFMLAQMQSGGAIAITFGKMLADSLNPFSGVSMEDAKANFDAQMQLLYDMRRESMEEIFGSLNLNPQSSPIISDSGAAPIVPGGSASGVDPLAQSALQDELDSKILIEQEYWEEKEKMAQDYADAETRIQGNLQAMRMGLASQAMDLIASNAKEGSAIQKAALIASKALSVAQIIINTQVAATSALMPPPIGLGPVAGIGFAASIKSMGYASAALVAAQAVASFDGGGYTGDGARSGGLDGKGGFMAMMHPQETVTDHTKGGGGGSGSQNYYDFRGSELSEGRVRAMIEQSGQVLEAKMRNSQARGR